MRNKPPLPCPWAVVVAPPVGTPLQRVRATEPQRGGSGWLDPPLSPDAQKGSPFPTTLKKLAGSLQREWQEEVCLGILSLDHPDNTASSWGLCAAATQLEAAGRRADEAESKRKRLALAGQLTGSAGLKRAAGLLRDMQAAPLATLRAPDGSFPTAPLAVDVLAAAAWGPR